MPSLIVPGLGETLAGLMDITVAGESLRLRYDASHYVSFAVSSTGGLTITPQAGQAVNVTTFAASAKTTLSAQTRVGDLFRVDSVAAPDTTGLTGAGIQIHYDPTNFGVLKCYDYTGAALKAMKIDSASLQITNAVSISTGGLTATNTTVATISQVTDTTGVVNARWTNNINYTVELGYTGAGSIAYLWGASGVGLALGANGAALLEMLTGGYIFAPNSTTPGASPVGGGYLYVTAGALKWMGPSGTVTTMGAA